MEQEETIRPDWPTISERVCVPAFEDYIQRNSSQIHQFIAKKGDVLIWHGRLTHRGSLAKNPNLMRKGLISHYSALSKRPDMPDRAKWNKGKWYFIHNNLLDEGSPSITIPITEKYKKILQPLVEKANNKLKRIVIG